MSKPPGPPGEPLKVQLDRNGEPCWSLSVWLTLRMFDIPFMEATPTTLVEASGQPEPGPLFDKAPTLVEGSLAVAGPLAILEFLAERHPVIWPDDRASRAQARAVASELCAGFPVLRLFLAARNGASLAGSRRLLRSLGAEIQRLRSICIELRGAASVGAGPFLFGSFSGADAMFAPLASRLLDRAMSHDATCTTYLGALGSLAAMRAWYGEQEQVRPEIAVDIAAILPIAAPPQPSAHEAKKPLDPAPPLLEIPPALTPPKLRLEDADRPSITYLDEQPIRGWRNVRLVEMLSVSPSIPPIPPIPTRPAAASATPVQAAPADETRQGGDLARRASEPSSLPRLRPTEPAEPVAAGQAANSATDGPEARTGDDAHSLMFQLRRPDPAAGGLNSLIDRFGRSIASAVPDANQEVASPLRPQDGKAAAPDPARQSNIRPAAIKPIGFSVHRRK
ncbi:MAG TPA: hypothetical protein VHL31_04750 [Geminicoccus sp.]|uniref:hypothetical protein n=1 Tax=Geminicoccus sp. TaxID=2024832 RepID=UPI002E3273CD|nr:hypothetical protein [Geminicoccus sp.]HEX2525596.1 hypothetical protein [Geminicoccus sp.]